jgi:hypothetical protein
MLLIIVLLSGMQVFGKLPVVKVRFANPVFEENTMTYRLDVEFQSDQPGLELFGVNVRFLFDNALLQFRSFGDFSVNYGSLAKPQVINGETASGSVFGFRGEAGFVNGTVQLKKQTTPVRLNSTDWTRLFSANFQVLDPDIFLTADEDLPFLVWDLKAPEEGGFLTGDDGVVITAVDPSPKMESAPVTEIAISNLLVPETISTRIKELTQEFKLRVWPNPTIGPVNIDLDWKGISQMELKVFNVLSEVVYQKKVQAGESVRFDLSRNVSGNYMIEMTLNDVRFYQKLVLDRK